MSRQLTGASGSYVLGRVGHGLKNVVVRMLIHERVPARLHGRAFAAYNGLRSGAELVALASGGRARPAPAARRMRTHRPPWRQKQLPQPP